MPLHINHRFLLQYAASCRGPILDYGCGAGEVVKAGQDSGLEIYGCETFYEGAHGQRKSLNGLLGKRILEMRDGQIPFPNSYFQAVVCNQVFEHVENLTLALSEIRRVLKPQGTLLALFPTREVWRENHCGVPLAHRFGFRWLLFWRCLGLGSFTKGKSRIQWARDFECWLKSYCHYRSQKEVEDALTGQKFRFSYCETEYMKFRGILLPIFLFRRLGFTAIKAMVD